MKKCILIILCSINILVKANNINDYGFEHFEELNEYLSNSSVNKIFRTEKFLELCNNIFSDSFDVLTCNFFESSLWKDNVVPNYFLEKMKIFSQFDFLTSCPDMREVLEVFKEHFGTYKRTNFVTKDNENEPINIIFIGDMHGNYFDFTKIIKDLISKGILTENLKIANGYRLVVLGDFVDRGSKSFELTLFLFLLKILNKKNVILLKGNHENKFMSFKFGFAAELYEKLLDQEVYILIYGKFLTLFNFLPEAYCLTVCNQNFLFSHAGFDENFDYNSFINQNDFRFIKNFENIDGSPTASPFLWDDISPYISEKKVDEESNRICYSTKYVEEYMNKHNIKAIFKGHDHSMPKCKEFENQKLDLFELGFDSSGLAELLESKIYLIISTSIFYENFLINYKSTYGILEATEDDYSCSQITCD